MPPRLELLDRLPVVQARDVVRHPAPLPPDPDLLHPLLLHHLLFLLLLLRLFDRDLLLLLLFVEGLDRVRVRDGLGFGSGEGVGGEGVDGVGEERDEEENEEEKGEDGIFSLDRYVY